MNKFNLLAEPYSMEQLAGMIDQSIKAAKEEFAGMEKVQAEIHEAEHAIELLSCQLNMLSLVAGTQGALEALNADGALESLCNKKIEEITAAVAVESLGEKVVEALKKVWEFVKQLLFKISQYITRLIEARDLKYTREYVVKNMTGATVATIDDGKQRNIVTVDVAKRASETLTALLKAAEIVEKYTKSVEQVEDKEQSKHDSVNTQALKDLVVAMEKECTQAVANCGAVIDACDSIPYKTLPEAGINTPEDAVKFVGDVNNVDVPLKIFADIHKVGGRIYEFGKKEFVDSGTEDREAQIFIQTAIAVRRKIASITGKIEMDAFHVQYQTGRLTSAIYEAVKSIVEKQKPAEEPAK